MPEPTFQDLLATYSEDLFIGRANELAIFERMITSDRPPCLILAISGQGGVGKTTLLDRFRSMAGDYNIATALADEGQLGVIEVLDHLAGQFGRNGVPFDTFTKRLQRYRELKQQIDADKDAPRGFLDFAARGAARIGMRAFKKHVPIAGDFAEVMLSKEAEDRIAEEAGTFATYVAQKFKQRDDRDLLLDTTKELTGQFLIDLSMQAQYRRIVLFFDTYEQTAPILDRWLRDLLRGQFGQFNANTRVVIAGRHSLGQHWTHFRGAVRQIELREFTADEARQFLDQSGIADTAVQDQFIQLSNRLPVLLAFLVSAPGSVPTELAGTAADRFLQGFTADERETALLSGVPRYFNQDILQVILAPDTAIAAFEWLTHQPFVRETERGWAYHDVVRTMLIRSLRHRSPVKLAQAHRQLAELYATKAEKLVTTDHKHYANSLWWRVEIEAQYHRLVSDPEHNLDLVLNTLVNALHPGLLLTNFQISQSDFGSIATLLRNVFEETGSHEIEIWIANLAEPLDAAVSPDTQSPEAIRATNTILNSLATRPSLGDRERSSSYLLLSALAFSQLDLDKAISLGSKAIDLQPDDGYNYQVRGRSYYEQKDYPAALADFAKAIELLPNFGYNYFWRGRTCYELKYYPAALADFAKAIELQPENGDNYWWRGRTYYELKNYPAALADFAKAIELEPDDGSNYFGRGRTYCELKDHSAAIADFAKAIELQPDNGYNYHWRGCTYCEMKDYPAALADFAKAIELQADEGYNHHWRGRTYYEMKDYPAALADFAKAIELQPDNGYNYNWRGTTYYEMKDYPAALVDFTKAVELQFEEGGNYHWRGRTYYEMKDYPAALADFAKAVELQVDDGYNRYWRGLAYYQLKDYAAALADFAKAIELQPEDPYNCAWYGRTQAALGNASAALADLQRSEELVSEEGRPAYMAAAGYIQLNRLDDAIRLLRLAFQRSPELLADIATDADFDPIRETPEFRALLSESDTDPPTNPSSP